MLKFFLELYEFYPLNVIEDLDELLILVFDLYPDQMVCYLWDHPFT